MCHPIGHQGTLFGGKLYTFYQVWRVWRKNKKCTSENCQICKVNFELLASASSLIDTLFAGRDQCPLQAALLARWEMFLLTALLILMLLRWGRFSYLSREDFLEL